MDNHNIYRKVLYERYISTHFGKGHKDSAKEFEIYSRYFKRNYLRFLPKNKNARILDIGCGMGHFLYFLEKEGCKNYIGIDVSEENIEFCRAKSFKVKKFDAFEFLNANKEPFDIIVMNDVIEHFNKKEVLGVLELIHKNLTKGGKIIIKVINSSNPILGASGRYLDFTHEIGFTEESLSQVLAICGFKDVAVYPQDIFVFYLNPFNYLAKFVHKFMNICFRLLFLLFGRKSTRIFTKSIIGVGIKV